MCRVLCVALTVAVVMAGAASSARVASAKTMLAAGTSLRVLYIGDSLTNGTAARPNTVSFPYLVTAGLLRHGDTVTAFNVSKGGVKTSYWTARPGAIPKDVNVAVVELGTNDAHSVPAPPQFDTDYRALLAAVRSKSPNAKMVCLSVWRPDDPPAAVSYDATIKADCPGRYLNIDRFAHAPNLSSIDGFHPNNAGHRLIADAILNVLAH